MERFIEIKRRPNGLEHPGGGFVPTGAALNYYANSPLRLFPFDCRTDYFGSGME